MKGYIIKGILLLHVLSFGKAALSQPVFKQNCRYIDSVEQLIRTGWCNDTIAYPEKYKKLSIEYDKKIIRALSKVFQDSFMLSQLDLTLSAMKSKKIVREKNEQGLIQVNKVHFTGNYISAELTVESIDDHCFRKKMQVSTYSIARCADRSYSVMDFTVLKKLFENDFDRLISISDYELVMANDFNKESLKAVQNKYSDYAFNLPGSSNEEWVNKIFLKQYNSDSSCCYFSGKVNKDFVALIRNDKVEIIRSLLYSPNYFYAVQAMESLIYLASVNKVVIDQRMKERMTAIRQSNTEMMIQHSYDVFEIVRGYKGLRFITDAAVIEKYRNSLR